MLVLYYYFASRGVRRGPGSRCRQPPGDTGRGRGQRVVCGAPLLRRGREQTAGRGSQGDDYTSFHLFGACRAPGPLLFSIYHP